MSFGVNVHRELFTPVWIENALSAEWNPAFVYNMECERIPCSRRSDSRARSFFFFCLREFFSRALLSERLEQAKRLVNEYMGSMNIIMIIMVSIIVVIITIRIIIKIINVIIIIIIIIIFALISPSLLDIKWTKVIMDVGKICKQLFSET